MPKFYNISDGYGDAEQCTLADYQAMNPAGEFKECWDGTIIEIYSDESGDWATVAISDTTDRRIANKFRVDEDV